MEHTLRKTLAVFPLVAACVAFGSQAQAQTATFGGELKGITCTASVVGGNTVKLPIAQPSDLPTVGSVAHYVIFTIALTACGTGADGTVARAMFYNATAGAVSSDGHLYPTFTPASAGGWAYRFRAVSASGSDYVPVRTSATIVVHTTDNGATIVNGAANLRYRVGYRRTGALTPGKGTASVNYVLYYL